MPSGRWTTLPCRFPEPDDDPQLMAAVRWTLGRLDDELSTFHEAIAARLLRMLVPDSGLRGNGRLTWVDAKYKAHLQLLAHRGWSGLAETTREAHRADLHQALAYASLDEVERVDSVLVYPELAADDRSRPAIATVAAGRRRVRLVLIGLPFGFRSPEHRETTMAEWRELLAA